MRLREIAWVFLKLGTIGFGGPAAHIALMEDEIVRRRAWFSREEFLDRLTATNLIPGPNSTEMAIHVGHRRAGSPGLLVAGACFILSAAVIVTARAWSYVRFGAYPAAGSAMLVIKPVIVAVVVQALWGLGRSAVRSRWLGVLAAGAVAAGLGGVGELWVIALSGGIAWLGHMLRRAGSGASGLALVMPVLLTTAGAVAGTPAGFSLGTMFLHFLKIGSVLSEAAASCRPSCGATSSSASGG
jgi:chromate transporter